jgi:CheY-like chemotaxis protein
MEDSGILLVDDDVIALALLKECFHQRGISIQCAENGENALQLMQQRPFALLLTDLQMPGMDGLELARKARRLVPNLPIVLCTGAATPEICALADQIGIARVVRKPIRFSELFAIIGSVASRNAVDASFLHYLSSGR